MALSRPTANASVGAPKELAAPPASDAAVYISPLLGPYAVRSPDLSYSVSISPTFLELKAPATAPQLANRYMELPQPQHSSEGSKPPHDFLSLYGGSSSNRAEHRSSPGVSTYLTTQDFLQPLERGGKNSHNTSSRGSEPSSAEGSSATSTASVEHVLPGGIGTYSISHISSFGQTNGKSESAPPVPPPPPPPHHPPMLHHHVNVNATESKPEVGRAAASSAPAFALWEERVRVVDANRTPDVHANVAKGDAAAAKEYLEYWTATRPKAELSFLSKNSFGLESSQQPPPSSSKQRPQTGQSFVEMMKSMKPISEDEDDDDEEYVDRNRENRKESSSQKVEATPKLEGKSNDQKANTPRSKHSATEQRRRSKINDRFQTLRELVPHSDQKRDKASFLLECTALSLSPDLVCPPPQVIEYIQVLQDKVRKYEATEQSWNQERVKTMVWDLCKKSPGHGDSPGDGSRSLVGTVLDCKQNIEVSDQNKPRTSNAMHDEISSATDIHPNSQNLMQHSKSNTVMPSCPSPYKEKEASGVFSKSMPLNLSMQQCVYSPFGMNFPHSIHLKSQAASEIHSLTTIPGINHGCMSVNAYPFDREKDANSTTPVLLSRFQENAANMLKTANGLENQWCELRSSQSSSIPQDSGRNGGISVKDENADTKSAAKPDQHSEPYFNSSARLSQLASQSESELPNKQLKTQSSSPDQRRESDAQLPANEQEQLVIQGGVINVSSVYSQGLLDTLTQALQNSGLDLSQANISVQIDLGRQAVASGAKTNTKEHSHNQEESSQNHQLQGHPRSADTFSEEQPQKRPKIENDI